MRREVLLFVLAAGLVAASVPVGAAEVGASGKCQDEDRNGGGFSIAVRDDPADAVDAPTVDDVAALLDGLASYALAVDVDPAQDDGDATDPCPHDDDSNVPGSCDDPSCQAHPDYLEAHVDGDVAYAQVCVYHDGDRPTAALNTDADGACPHEPRYPGPSVVLP